MMYYFLIFICLSSMRCIYLSRADFIRTDLYEKYCYANATCVQYVTPVSDCYNGQVLFPADPSWASYDIKDDVVDNARFVRKFYASESGACQDQTDQFELPFNECVGPFGQPRPWGIFALIQINNYNGTFTTQSA